MIKLAIVIPFYKGKYFKETLESIQKQTNQRFNLYIGNDDSSYDIEKIIDGLDTEFKKKIIYYRFLNNIGSTSLIKQWERCINLSVEEPYIWLFSDDDIMPPDAVKRFYDFVEMHLTIDIARFNVQIINDINDVIRKSQRHPDLETSKEFLKRRLNGMCISTACEYIFSRKIYVSKGGFIEFPLAWASDDASWATFAEDGGIATIPGNPISWRMSEHNISSESKRYFKQKIQSSILFIKFIDNKYEFSNEEKMKWLLGQLSLLGNSLRIKWEFYLQLFKSKEFKNKVIFKHIINIIYKWASKILSVRR